MTETSVAILNKSETALKPVLSSLVEPNPRVLSPLALLIGVGLNAVWDLWCEPNNWTLVHLKEVVSDRSRQCKFFIYASKDLPLWTWTGPAEKWNNLSNLHLVHFHITCITCACSYYIWTCPENNLQEEIRQVMSVSTLKSLNNAFFQICVIKAFTLIFTLQLNMSSACDNPSDAAEIKTSRRAGPLLCQCKFL